MLLVAGRASEQTDIGGKVNARNRLGRGILSALALALLAISASARAEQCASRIKVPPSITLGPLFERVARSDLFADGKSWADAIPRRGPDQILAEYQAEPPSDREELRRFVARNFTLPAPRPAQRLPAPGLPLRPHIEALWPVLTRTDQNVSCQSSLLPLPAPYVVPGGRFTEIYYWDSYFTMLGLGPRDVHLRRSMVDDFAYLIRTYGHVPNGSRSYYLSRSQPPFFSLMVELTDPAHPRRAYARYLDDLRAEYVWWMKGADQAAIGRPAARVVRMPDGSLLNRYWDDRDAPRDESFRADVLTAEAAGRPGIYRELRAAAESGWDFSSRWFADKRTLARIRTTDLVPPDLNSLMYQLELAIAAGCAEDGDAPCAREFGMQAERRGEAIRRYLWNGPIGTFDDYDWKLGRPVGNITAAGLYPLFAGIATKRQAESVAGTVASHLLKRGGLVASDQVTGEQWDAPNGWAPLQWIAVTALRNYGQNKLAAKIARRWLATVTENYDKTGKLLEKYDVVDRRPGGGGEYPLQDGFGWTNGVTIALLRLYPAPTPEMASGSDNSTR
jgi:alpha,alpha-trehalase